VICTLGQDTRERYLPYVPLFSELQALHAWHHFVAIGASIGLSRSVLKCIYEVNNPSHLNHGNVHLQLKGIELMTKLTRLPLQDLCIMR
jgi:hypothetical protein